MNQHWNVDLKVKLLIYVLYLEVFIYHLEPVIEALISN